MPQWAADYLPHLGIIVASVGLGIFLTLNPMQVGTWLEKVEFGVVVAALIAVVGYVFDARKGRSAEVRAAQMQRASDQMSCLLVPLNVNFIAMISTLCDFLTVNWKYCDIQDRTELEDNRDRVVAWIWRTEGGLMSSSKRRLFNNAELPAALSSAIAEDPASQLALKYRRWIRYEWVPGVRRIGQIIDSGCHWMEPVPIQRLEEMFGPKTPMSRNSWTFSPRGVFFSMWLSYWRGWDTILAQWDDGDFSSIRPDSPFPTGIFFIVLEGQEIVGDIQQQLTGQSQMHGGRGNGKPVAAKNKL